MAALYEEGLTLQEIGERFGVSRERVRQILGSLGDAATASEARSARREARAGELAAQVGEFLSVHRDGIVAMSEGGTKRPDAEARYTLLFPEVSVAVVREAMVEAGVLFDVDVQEFAFADTVIEAAVWYVLARELGLTGDRQRAALEMDLDEMEGVGQPLLREGVAPAAVAEILSLIHAAREHARAGAEAGQQIGIAVARYNTWRETVLAELGMESAKGVMPWPPTSQTVMKRLGGGAWAKAQLALGLTPDRRGRPPGLLVFEPEDYPAAVRDFLSDAASSGMPGTYEGYESWVAAEERSGRRRPSAPSIRLHFRGWTAAKRAATADGSVPAGPRSRQVGGEVLRAAAALHHAQQEIDRAHLALAGTRPAERTAYLEQFLKTFMQEFEHRRRTWIRTLVELDPTAVPRRLADPGLTAKHRRLLGQRPPALGDVLTDMYLDKLGPHDPRLTDGWVRPDAQAVLDSVDEGVILRFRVLKESRNYLVHGSKEARDRLTQALGALAAEDDVFALKQSLTARVLLSWYLANDRHRLRLLVTCVPDLWKQMIVGEALMATV